MVYHRMAFSFSVPRKIFFFIKEVIFSEGFVLLSFFKEYAFLHMHMLDV